MKQDRAQLVFVMLNGILCAKPWFICKVPITSSLLSINIVQEKHEGASVAAGTLEAERREFL